METTETITTTLLADKKKLLKRIKNLRDLISKGNTGKNLEGSNSIFEKAYLALKDQPRVPLKKVHISMFGEYGFLRASNFFIAKSQNTFSLFKAREVELISEKQKRQLIKKANDIIKTVGTDKKSLQKVTKDIPFLEWKPLSKSDIAESLYQESKKDKILYNAVAKFHGKEKLLKKDFTDLNYGEMSYIAVTNEERIRHTKFYTLCDRYVFIETKDELRLDQKADVTIIATEEMRAFKESVDVVENRIMSLQADLQLIKAQNGKDRSSKILFTTMELLTCRKALDDINQEIEKKVGDPSGEALRNIIRSMPKNEDGKYKSDELQYIGKDEILYQGSPDENCMKIGLKSSSELVGFFTDNGGNFAQELGIEVKKEIQITNYGVFSDANTDKALENLLLYAKSINEMVNDNDVQEKQLQEYSGNFAI